MASVYTLCTLVFGSILLVSICICFHEESRSSANNASFVGQSRSRFGVHGASHAVGHTVITYAVGHAEHPGVSIWAP